MDQQSTFRLAIWALFFLGVWLHILLRARASVASSSNSVGTVLVWWELNWRELGWELFLDGVGLMFWEVSPHLFGDVLKLLLPITYGTAPVMGFAVDRFINSSGFILGFAKVDMPRIAPQNGSKHP